MCCGTADWKREEVPDHKFDFIDVRDYHNTGLWTRTRYGFLFLLIIKSVAVYIADIYTAVTLLAFNKFNGSIYSEVENNPSNSVAVPIIYGKWIFFGCIIFSFLLLAYEAHKSRAIIRSRDISYAYTNVMANNYYSLRSYDHFCFFSQINNSTKKKDEIAFFIFFTFKGWKRLIVADGPRQVINALTLYGLIEVSGYSTNVEDYYGGNVITGIMLLTMIFTLVVFTGSAILLIIASAMYLPLLCYMKGNLKKFCCHKIDKRVTELIQVKKKERVARQAAIARAEAKGDFTHLMNKKGVIVGQKMAQPTLPNLDVDLLDEKNVGRSATRQKTRRGGRQAAAGGYRLYANANASGEEFGSQTHLVLHQGPAGGMSVSGHSVQASVDDYGGAAPSLPPTVHSSPDAHPFYYRGLGMGASATGLVKSESSTTATASLLPQLGQIDTRPQLLVQRSMGEASGVMRKPMGTINGNGYPFGPSPSYPRSAYGSAQDLHGAAMGGSQLGGPGASLDGRLRRGQQDQHYSQQHARNQPSPIQEHYPQQQLGGFRQQQQQQTVYPPWQEQEGGKELYAELDTDIGYGYAYAEEADMDPSTQSRLRGVHRDAGAAAASGSGPAFDPSTKSYLTDDLSTYAPYPGEVGGGGGGVGGPRVGGAIYSMHEEDVAILQDVYDTYHQHRSVIETNEGGAEGGGGGGVADADADADRDPEGFPPSHEQDSQPQQQQQQRRRFYQETRRLGDVVVQNSNGSGTTAAAGAGTSEWDGGDQDAYESAPAYEPQAQDQYAYRSQHQHQHQHQQRDWEDQQRQDEDTYARHGQSNGYIHPDAHGHPYSFDQTQAQRAGAGAGAGGRSQWDRGMY